MNIPKLDEMVASAMDFTEKVTTKWNARLAGSQACLECADHLEEEFSTFCDSTHHQEFSVHPGAFLGYIRINIVIYFMALIALYFNQTLWAVILSSLAFLITALEFFVYKEFVDPLFPKKKGKNIVGTIEPDKEVKQQVIISAHHDSAHIFNFLAKNPKTYIRNVILGTSSQLAMLIFSWLLLGMEFFNAESDILYWVLTTVLSVSGIFAAQMWFFYDKEGTPGAGDNMICTAIAMEVGKYFAHQKKEGNGLQHTRVIVASWDAEECGLRGARAYSQVNKDQLLATKTYNFNLECMYDHEEMALLTSDLNGFVQLSPAMIDECLQISQDNQLEVDTLAFPFLAGGTDAAEFSKIGVEATTLAAMNWLRKEGDVAYHTLRDTIDAVDEIAVSRSISLGIHYIIGREKAMLPEQVS
ncbi:MAG: M28 family peptidase [Bacteroidota bacterium]